MKQQYYIFALFFLTTGIFAQPGALDITFGSFGKVTTSFGTSNDQGQSIVIQPDGKLIVVGEIEYGTFPEADFGIARYNSDGALDYSFGTFGKIKIDFGYVFNTASTVKLLQNGKILVGGTVAEVYSFQDFALAKFNVDGSLDNTFGVNGKITFDVGPTDFGFSLAIQTDGKILFAGSSHINSKTYFTMVRCDATGILDTTFGTNGKVITSFGGSHDFGFSITLQSDGKIVFAGSSDSYKIAIARYNTDGSLDNSFGVAGKKLITVGNENNGGYCCAIQSDGKILVCGYSRNNSDADFVLVRLNPDGSLDSTFNGNGIVTTNFGSSNDLAYSIAIQTDGKILVSGSTGSPNFNFALVRYNINGSLDNSFGFGGKLFSDFSGSDDECHSIALQPDGRIILAGYAGNGADADFALVRYNCGILDVNEVVKDNSTFIYPNPVSGILNIKVLQKSDLEILNIEGQALRTIYNVDKMASFDVSKLSSGVYIIKVMTDKGIVTKKFIKQ